jgi:hypothetical protein
MGETRIPETLQTLRACDSIRLTNCARRGLLGRESFDSLRKRDARIISAKSAANNGSIVRATRHPGCQVVVDRCSDIAQQIFGTKIRLRVCNGEPSRVPLE